MNSPASPDPLGPTLSTWRIYPRKNSQFRTAVWSRIGQGAAGLPWAAYARRHAPALLGAVALAMVAGGFFGRERARARAAAESASLATAYVQQLDARSMNMR